MNIRLMKVLGLPQGQGCGSKRENANIDGDTAMGTMFKYIQGAKEFYDCLFKLDH